MVFVFQLGLVALSQYGGCVQDAAPKPYELFDDLDAGFLR
jgi:hypothetical protein